METKGNQSPITNAAKGSQSPITNTPITPIVEDGVVYIAIKGSLYGHDTSAFGLGQEEIRALSKRFPGSGTDIINGVTIKTNVLNTINLLSQLGYKIISSTGETEITWTMQRDV